MPFLGKQPNAGFATIVKDTLTADGSTTQFTLSKQVASTTDIAVFVGNVRQEPTTAYTVNGTTLDFGSGNAPATGLDMYVLHIGGTQETSTVPADGTISSAKIVSGAVTDAKIASGISSSKLTGALPALDGSALTGAGSMVKLAHTTVTAANTATYPFNFTNVFSSTYNNYFFTFTIASGPGTTGAATTTMYCQFGNGGTYVTASNACRGSSVNSQINVSTVASQYYLSTTGIHQLLGTLSSSENGQFTGSGIITNPFDSYYPVNVNVGPAMMQYFTTDINSWQEDGASKEDNADKASYTDVRFGLIYGNASGSDITNSAGRRTAYGHVTIYGMVD